MHIIGHERAGHVPLKIFANPGKAVESLYPFIGGWTSAVQADVDAAASTPQQCGNGGGKAQATGMHILPPAVFPDPQTGLFKIMQDARFASAPAEKAPGVQDMLLMQALQNRQNGVTLALAAPQIAIYTFAVAQMPVHIDADRPEKNPYIAGAIAWNLPESRAVAAELVPSCLQTLKKFFDMLRIGRHIQPSASKRKTRNFHTMHVTTGLYGCGFKIDVMGKTGAEV